MYESSRLSYIKYQLVCLKCLTYYYFYGQELDNAREDRTTLRTALMVNERMIIPALLYAVLANKKLRTSALT